MGSLLWIGGGSFGRLYGRFTKYRESSLRANDGTDATSGATIFTQENWVIAFGGQPSHIKRHHMLGTFRDTQFTTFAKNLINFDPSLNGHRQPPKKNLW
jgi:hypothetical protein